MAPQNRRIVTLRDISESYDDSLPEGEQGDTSTGTTSDLNSAKPGPSVPAASYSKSTPNNPLLAAPFCQPATASSTKSNNPTGNIPLLPITDTSLPMVDACRQTLERIWKEFSPIIARRGYNVRSISELCCCGDGLDSRRRTPLRKQSDNVWGYNQTTFVRRGGRGGGHQKAATSHTIHLRLRQPKHHATQLLSWEDVAGTMAHELSHCVHQKHSKAFYQLMEEILEEHATQQVQNMGSIIYGGSNASGPPSTTTTTILPTCGGQRLGGNRITEISNGSGKSRLLDGGKPFQGGGGYRLSPNTTGGGGSQRAPLSPKSRREAMARAAEKRQKQMEQLRRMIEASKEPCVIEILDDDDDDDDDDYDDDDWQHELKNPNENDNSGGHRHLRKWRPDTKPRGTNARRPTPVAKSIVAASKPAASTRNDKARPLHIDDDSILIDISTAAAPRATKKTKKDSIIIQHETIDLTSPLVAAAVVPVAVASSPTDNQQEWECGRCTFHNRPLALVCAMCHEERTLPLQGQRAVGGPIIEID